MWVIFTWYLPTSLPFYDGNEYCIKKDCIKKTITFTSYNLRGYYVLK